MSLIEFSKRSDLRGSLIPIEAYKDVPFAIERIFYIKGMDDYPRGFHAHRKSIQVLVPILGSFDITLSDGQSEKSFTLDRDNQGLLIPLYTWLKMFNFSSDCVILVLCSYKYDEAEYIRNYGDFLKAVKKSTSPNINCFSLTEQLEQIKGETMSALKAVVDNSQFVLGPQLENFERNFAQYNHVSHCLGVSNGTSAMICALKALQLNPGDEVIVQSNTYIAAPLAIEFCNLCIKVVDIDDSLNLDLNKLETSITNKTKVVLVVHLYGSCPDMDRLTQIIHSHDLYLIEDCAQAHGSSFNGQKLGTFGDIGCFSFYPSKNLGSFGEGGAIITNNQSHYEYIKRYRNYGSVNRYQWEIKGTNDRMHNIQAAVLDVKLKYLDSWNDKRKELARLYDIELGQISQVQIPINHSALDRNYHLYVIRVQDRAELMSYLKDQGINCGIHYPCTFYKSPAFESMNNIDTHADVVSNEILSLPMYPELSSTAVKNVCQRIKDFYQC